MNTFDITYRGWQLPQEDSIPALLTVGNGRIGIRATVPELDTPHAAGTLLAGFFDALPRPELKPETFNAFMLSWSHMGLVDHYHLEECLVNCPDPLYGEFSVAGEPFSFDDARSDELVRSLNLQTGEITFRIPLVTCSGKHATLIRRRFARMDQDRLVYEKCCLTAEDFSDTVTYTAAFCPNSENFNISGIYDDCSTPEDEAYYKLYDVLQNRVESGLLSLRLRGRVRGQIAQFVSSAASDGVCRPEGDKLVYDCPLLACGSMEVSRICAYSCSQLDGVHADTKRILSDNTCSYEQALAASTAAWAALWAQSDLQIDGDETAQRNIRHSIYQLLIACCRTSDRVSVAAKGLTGEGYRGMVFWDTDIHMMPFYLYTQPRMAENIVKFRCHTLNGARAKAARYGRIGASYPWETGASGEEECEDFLKLITHQLHITADVAYALGEYLHVTGDISFLPLAAEVLAETARFWLSQGQVKDGILHLADACGPDELHLESNDNAYVCNLAAHNLTLAEEFLDLLEAHDRAAYKSLCDRIRLTVQERKSFSYFKTHMAGGIREDGLFEQCEGFFGLRDEIVQHDTAVESPALTQTVKQADVLMLLYLLPQLTDRKQLLANWNYYEPRTTHSSSLSYGVHGIIANQLGLTDKARSYLDRSLAIDLDGAHGPCTGGLHLAADGMSWSAIVNGMCGVHWCGSDLTVTPQLPAEWVSVRFTLCYRTYRLALEISGRSVRVCCTGSGSVPIVLHTSSGSTVLKEGESVCLSC